MSTDLRNMIDKVKNWKQFLTESVGSNILHINRDMLFNTNNLGQEVDPYSYPDIDEDLEYIATFIKGKSKNINDIRILMRGVKSGNNYFMFLKDDFSGSFLHYIGLNSFEKISDKHYKFKSYNYYFFREGANDVDILLKKWLGNNPKPFQFSSFKINLIKNYTYIFDYNSNKY